MVSVVQLHPAEDPAALAGKGAGEDGTEAVRHAEKADTHYRAKFLTAA